MKIKIKNNLFFDSEKPPLIIAEISSNHGGNKDKFIKHITEAKKSGCELVKIQTYEASDLTLKSKNSKFILKKGLWKNTSLWNLYKKAETPFSWHYDAFKLAKKRKINLFSTPFSLRSLNFLKRFNPPIYKISSFEITDLKLVTEIAKIKKPVILSTGLASLDEIKSALKIINKFHNKVVIMYCVSGYPTPIREMNLKTILSYKKIFPNNLIGLSDHTNTIESSLASIPFNIVAIEKHFKLNNKIKSPDSKFSITSKEMQKLNSLKKNFFFSLGNETKKIKNAEKNSLNFRRSLFARENILKGDLFSERNIKTLRPKIGLCSSKYFKILGKKSKKNIKKNKPIFGKFIY